MATVTVPKLLFDNDETFLDTYFIDNKMYIVTNKGLYRQNNDQFIKINYGKIDASEFEQQVDDTRLAEKVIKCDDTLIIKTNDERYFTQTSHLNTEDENNTFEELDTISEYVKSEEQPDFSIKFNIFDLSLIDYYGKATETDKYPPLQVINSNKNVLTFSYNLFSQLSNDARVLVSFNTGKNVNNLYAYLDSTYLNDYSPKGDLEINLVSPTNNPAFANRAYIYNEYQARINPKINYDLNEEPSSEYPSTFRDKAKYFGKIDECFDSDFIGNENFERFSYYSWPENIEESSLEEIKNIEPEMMKNSDGGNIYLCDESGKNLVTYEGDVVSDYELFGTSSLQMLQSCPKPSLKIDAFKRHSYIQNEDKLIENSFKSNDASSSYIYRFVQNDNVYIVANGFNNSLTALTFNEVVTDGYDEFKQEKLSEMTEEEFDERFQERDGKWFDTVLDCFPYKQNKRVTLYLSIPYTYKNGAVYETNVKLIIKNNEDDEYGTLSLEDGRPITGIYFNPKGYGGNKNGYESSIPWDNDASCFDMTKFSKNICGQNIFLLDENGESIANGQSEGYVEKNDNEVYAENLTNGHTIEQDGQILRMYMVHDPNDENIATNGYVIKQNEDGTETVYNILEGRVEVESPANNMRDIFKNDVNNTYSKSKILSSIKSMSLKEAISIYDDD